MTTRNNNLSQLSRYRMAKCAACGVENAELMLSAGEQYFCAECGGFYFDVPFLILEATGAFVKLEYQCPEEAP